MASLPSSGPVSANLQLLDMNRKNKPTPFIRPQPRSKSSLQPKQQPKSNGLKQEPQPICSPPSLFSKSLMPSQPRSDEGNKHNNGIEATTTGPDCFEAPYPHFSRRPHPSFHGSIAFASASADIGWSEALPQTRIDKKRPHGTRGLAHRKAE
ncbi:hypothetical protein ACRALDRAFT_205601 [Sodiomyces alcalophilus JCM 7366]|uniref:uncharacterized protein n=1 Tax=Sodiomyces alcalophilus JCM 7366 TaxID=591952 RepID=UPI0039B4E14D